MNATVPASASPTPILDRLAPLPKAEGSMGSARLFLAIWLALVGVAMMVAQFWHPPAIRRAAHSLTVILDRAFPGQWAPATFLWWPLQAILAIMLAIAIHEGAHSLVGVLAGFRFNSLRIGRVQFDRPFRISLYRGRGTGSGGWASLFPVKQDHLIARTVVMLLAGPCSNLLSVAALWLASGPRGSFSALFFLWSLVLGLINLIPFRSRAVFSDGGRILMLLQSRARGERWLSILKLVEELRTGVPFEDLSPAFVAKAVAIEDDSPDTVSAFALAYGVAFWGRRDDEAARALETCLRHCSLSAPVQRHALMSDAAVFQARRRRRPDLAQQWLSELPQRTEYPWIRLRVDAAIREAQGDPAGARQKLEEVETMLLAVPNQAMREIWLRGLRRWQTELQP